MRQLIKLPSTVSVKVHEETASQVHLVLPMASGPEKSRELTNEELESAAGGMAPRVELRVTSTICGPITPRKVPKG